MYVIFKKDDQKINQLLGTNSLPYVLQYVDETEDYKQFSDFEGHIGDDIRRFTETGQYRPWLNQVRDGLVTLEELFGMETQCGITIDQAHGVGQHWTPLKIEILSIQEAIRSLGETPKYTLPKEGKEPPVFVSNAEELEGTQIQLSAVAMQAGMLLVERMGRDQLETALVSGDEENISEMEELRKIYIELRLKEGGYKVVVANEKKDKSK